LALWLVEYLLLSSQAMSPVVDQTEYYSGEAQVTKAAADWGREAWKFEKQDDPVLEDILSPQAGRREYHTCAVLCVYMFRTMGLYDLPSYEIIACSRD